MAIVREYRTCDICGKKLSNDIEEVSYRIEPRNKIRMKVWGYILDDPYDSFWTHGLDICTDCWEDMKEWIKENRKNE
jgi:hypothetical protein